MKFTIVLCLLVLTIQYKGKSLFSFLASMKEDNKDTKETIFISVRDAAKLSGIGTAKMYELCKRDDINFVVKQGDKNGKFLVHKAKFLNWIDNVKEI